MMVTGCVAVLTCNTYVKSCLVVCCYDTYTKEARVGNLSNSFKTRRKDATLVSVGEAVRTDRGDSVNELIFMKTC